MRVFRVRNAVYILVTDKDDCLHFSPYCDDAGDSVRMSPRGHVGRVPVVNGRHLHSVRSKPHHRLLHLRTHVRCVVFVPEIQKRPDLVG